MKTFFIKTFGCQMNFSDSERIAAFVKNNDLKPVENIDQADLVIFNTCGVRQTAEDRVFGQIHNLLKNSELSSGYPELSSEFQKPFIIVTGCVAHRKDVQRKLKGKVDLFVSIDELFKLPALRNLSKEKKIENLKFNENCKLKIKNSSKRKLDCHYLKTTPIYKNSKKILVPIMTGCNNFCSYCVVPRARGRERSRDPHEIFYEIEKAVASGCQGVLLLGQNVNSYQYGNRKSEAVNRNKKTGLRITDYGFQETVTFPVLLDHLAETFPIIKFKFLTSHPKDFSDELIETIAKHSNIPSEIHLPIQSGSDKVLKAMNRPYTQEHYLKLIEKIRTRIPGVKITTDVIVGFPTETEEEFQETVKVFKKIKFDGAYVNKYSARPETTAEKLGDPILWDEKKKREKILRSLLSMINDQFFIWLSS